MKPNIKNIKIPEHHLLNMRLYYITRLKELEQEIIEIKQILSQLNHDAHGFGEINEGGAKISSIEYRKTWSFSRKAMFLISKAEKPLTTKEIVDSIVNKYEPELLPIRAKVVDTLSSVLSAGSKPGGKFLKETNLDGKYVFSLRKN